MNAMQRKLLRNMETAWNAANDIVIQMINADSTPSNDERFTKALYMRTGISVGMLIIKHNNFSSDEIKNLVMDHFE